MSNIGIMKNPPGRRLGQQALVLRVDPEGSGRIEALMVDPEYMDGFTLPGGSAEQGELPHFAARRHLETETGLVLPLRSILAVDYVSAAKFPEGIDLVYSGGLIRPEQNEIVRLHRPPKEIRRLHWVPRSKVATVMNDGQSRRVQDAWDSWEHENHLPLLVNGVSAPVS
ncbi:NUDIX domain-containing protein [Kitasatospora sp. NPDC088160]|uniref:NUDIX domain-containing protein n=1 Tax=Kitasatospora sp. NPDC088160 TaxID=3364072 RepID=UPI0037FE8B50